MTILMPLWPMANTGLWSHDDQAVCLLCRDERAVVILYHGPSTACDGTLDFPITNALPT